jgi:hypothetical protein
LSSRSLFNKALIPSIIRFGLFAASFFAIKFGVGFAMAGERALSIFGYYGGSGTAVELVESTILADSTLENLLVTSGGQILMTVMILGIAVPVSIIGLLDSVFGNKTNFAPVAFRSLFAITLLNMMAVVAMFEAWQNLTNWMHTRYHSYLIPLSLVVLVEAYVRSDAAGNKLIKRLVTSVFLVFASVNLITAAVPYGTNWIDAPDFRAHIDNLFLSSTAIVISIGLAIWWLWLNKAPIVGALVLALRDYIPQDELDRTVLVGDNQTNMERALFLTLSGEARKIPAPAEGFDVKQLEASDRWLIKVGEPLILGLGAPTISGTDFSLYSLSPENTLAPRKNEVNSFSNSCESPAEGAWACGNSVSVTTSGVLPGSPEIDLIFEVAGPEANSTLEFALGKTVLSGEFPVGTYAVSLAFPGEVTGGSLEIRLGAGSQVDRTPDSKFLRIISLNVVKR